MARKRTLEIGFRCKGLCDGATSLAEMIAALEGAAAQLREMHADGATLAYEVADDYPRIELRTADPKLVAKYTCAEEPEEAAPVGALPEAMETVDDELTALTVRDLLEALHMSLGMGTMTLDAPVRVEQLNVDDDSDHLVAFAALHGSQDCPELTLWCCFPDELDVFDSDDECDGLADDAPPLTATEEADWALRQKRASEAAERFATAPTVGGSPSAN